MEDKQTNIIIEDGEIKKVIPETPEVPAIPATPEQKITVTKEELLDELSESTKKSNKASDDLLKIDNDIQVFLGKKTLLQKNINKELQIQNNIQNILDILLKVEPLPVPDDIIEE